MNSKERIRAALKRQPVDRVPVVLLYSLPYMAKKFNIEKNVLRHMMQDPSGTILALQREQGLDPVLNLITAQEPDFTRFANLSYSWLPGSTETWQINDRQIGDYDGWPLIERTYSTPSGELKAQVVRETFGSWTFKAPMEDELNLDLLRFRPSPKNIVFTPMQRILKVIDQYSFSIINVSGVWQEACSLRGMANLIFDMHDRPEWLTEFFGILRDYTIEMVHQIATLRADAILLNESYVGLGISPKDYQKFILPFDREIVRAAQAHGLIVSYHNCGKSKALLELMADTGTDAIETLTPPESSGDVDLKDAKKRIGHRVALWGGFNERVLNSGDPKAVKEEVKKCLDAAAFGGGYILRGTGIVYESQQNCLEALIEAVEEYS